MMGSESVEVFENLQVGEREKTGDGDKGGVSNWPPTSSVLSDTLSADRH